VAGTSNATRAGGFSVTLSPCHLVTLSLLLVAGCDWPGKPDPEERPEYPDRVTKFEKLFGQNCAGCHGADGKMGPAPPLNDPLFRAGIPAEEVERVLTNGRKGTQMPAFARLNGGTLTPAQIQILVHEIKGTPYKVEANQQGQQEVKADAAGKAPAWGKPSAYPDDAPAYLSAKSGDSGRGKKVFERACMQCHGSNGTGGEKQPRINDPVFLELMSNQVLRRVAITGRSDLGMPDYKSGLKARGGDYKPLTGQDVDDLVALFGEWRDGGSGRAK
jgi:mono/diheme cytochrome c family protein